jgi:HEPN domain-containing protein
MSGDPVWISTKRYLDRALRAYERAATFRDRWQHDAAVRHSMESVILAANGIALFLTGRELDTPTPAEALKFVGRSPKTANRKPITKAHRRALAPAGKAPKPSADDAMHAVIGAGRVVHDAFAIVHAM